MPKQVFALVFAAFAYFMLLSHGVIPHHHHGSMVCIEIFHSNQDSHSHDNDLCITPHHSEPNEESSEQCLLNHMVMMYPSGTRQTIEEAGQPIKNKIPFVLRLALLSNYCKPQLVKINLPFRQHPTYPTYFNDYVRSSLGLRAPPAA